MTRDKTREQLAAGRRIGRARALIERVAVERKMAVQIKRTMEAAFTLRGGRRRIHRLSCICLPGARPGDAQSGGAVWSRHCCASRGGHRRSRLGPGDRRAHCEQRCEMPREVAADGVQLLRCAQGECGVAATARWEGSDAGVVDMRAEAGNAVQGSHYIAQVRCGTQLCRWYAGNAERWMTPATSWGRVPGTHGDNLLPPILAQPPLVDGLLWDVRWSAGLGLGIYPPLGNGRHFRVPRAPPETTTLGIEGNALTGATCEALEPPHLGLNAVAVGSVVPALNVGFWNTRGFFVQIGLRARPRRKHECLA